MMFQLWDVETGNMIGAYDSETAALAVVRGLLTTHGSDYVETLALARVTRRGSTTTLALGRDLVERASSIVAQTAGALRSDQPMLSPREEKIAAEDAMAEDAAAQEG